MLMHRWLNETPYEMYLGLFTPQTRSHGRFDIIRFSTDWNLQTLCFGVETAGIQFAARSPVGWSEVKSSVGTPHPEPLTK